MKFLGDLIPKILGLISEYVPMKGYRNAVFASFLAVALFLQGADKLPEDVAEYLIPALAALVGLFAGKHEEK